MALSFISVFEAMMGDVSVKEGKNLVYFMLIYVIGDVFRMKQTIIERINLRHFVYGWVLFNTVLVTLWMLSKEHVLGKVVWHLCFPYDSPILIFNSTWLFVIFSRIKISSMKINLLAGSVLSIYILQDQPLLRKNVINPFLSYIYHNSENSIWVLLGVVVVSAMFMATCILIDQIFKPIFELFLIRCVSVIAKWKKSVNSITDFIFS